jgi:hypothetical protein
MTHPDNFKNIARLLRGEALHPVVSQEQPAQAINLAEYCEKLAVDPCTEIADQRYA